MRERSRGRGLRSDDVEQPHAAAPCVGGCRARRWCRNACRADGATHQLECVTTMTSPRKMQFRLAKCWAVPTLLFLTIVGCAPGIEWRDFKYEPVRDLAQRDQRLMFVYFRHWAAVACTKFEDEILKDPAVLAESRAFYCVPLAFDWDRTLAEKFGVREIPGVAIVDPAGRVITRLQGVISRDELINEMRRARAEFSSRATAAAKNAP